ncbi:sugar phosphate isomerase/epimerase [Pelagicoccus sp. NFK12]|uniref:Sugar phosphate isomerase/epimerase n=1 Tax=Pelagicoccus enzymogenes TaxID=2773457 RepID=A0A927FAS5_9BACT|nr:TIM barrel protein [Pelagicoccus enzymogenes]MBD5780018.1 sugar phosphate isomerase/epimerase [Pelagicoccus enzymogenes]MDQ8198588.1 TIM barrel protein [Pelagicoccus enzymogenes]
MKIAINTVTLREHSLEKVVSILSDNKVKAVEWAGDAHVPPGNLETAERAKSLCEQAGIECTSYGSYYQCDEQGQGDGPFRFNLGATVALDTAVALGVDAIRVWAGRKASADADEAYREEVARCLAAFCDQADSLGMTVHLEFHRNTLTDTVESALALMDTVAKGNLYSYWQPRHGIGIEENVADIEALGDRLSHVHVFHWLLKEDGKTVERRPLKEGRERWERYFAALRKRPQSRYAMMEFVMGDALDQLQEDLSVLRLINGAVDPYCTA